MYKKYFIITVGLFLTFFLIGYYAFAGGYKNIKPEELKSMMGSKDFFLLDVHIPEQPHIPGTDAFIDYRKIRENAYKLPADKHTKIVVYCRSGGMSRSAANDLMDMGYTHVYNLKGGTRAFNKLK